RARNLLAGNRARAAERAFDLDDHVHATGDHLEHLGQRRDAFRTAYEQSAQLLERHFRYTTRGAGNTRHIVIVENNDDVVRGQARVELDAVGAVLQRRAE